MRSKSTPLFWQLVCHSNILAYERAKYAIVSLFSHRESKKQEKIWQFRGKAVPLHQKR